MSEIKQMTDMAIRMATASIIDALRIYKDGMRKSKYDAGYDDGLDQAIRLVQLFQAKLDEPRQKLDD